MKILLLSVDFPPHTDGVSTLSYHYARRLAERGHKVAVVGPGSPGTARADSFAPFRTYRFQGYGWGVLRFFPFAFRSLAALWRFRPDVVLPTNIGYGGVLCFLLSLVGGPRYVTFAYAYEFLKFRGRRIARRFYNAIYRRSAFVVAISEFTRSRLVEFGVAEDRIRVCPPGVVAAAEGGASPRAGRVVGTCGRLIQRKGHDLVIRALPRLVETFPDVRYRVAGEGPERETLEALADRLDVGDHVEFLGRVPSERLPEFYRSLDLFVMPSREDARSGHAEGFGIVYLEAAVHGVPSVGSRTGGIPEAILDGVTGGLVAPDDPDALGRVLAELLGDPERLAALGKAARDRACDAFGWDKQVDTFLDCLESECRVGGGDAGTAASVAANDGGPKPSDGLRVAVLTRTGRASGARLARAVASSRHQLCGVLAERRATMIRRVLRRRGLLAVVRRLGPAHLVRQTCGAVFGRGRRGTDADAVPMTVVKALNSEEAVKILGEWRADLLIVANAPILEDRVFQCARFGGVNFHSGRLPEFGGLASEFWALYEGEREVWSTIHKVAEQLDSGDILAERAIPVRVDDTPDSLHEKCITAAEELVSGVLETYAQGGGPVRSPGPARLRPWPTAAQRRELRRRLQNTIR